MQDVSIHITVHGDDTCYDIEKRCLVSAQSVMGLENTMQKLANKAVREIVAAVDA